ncbi:ImmA/IrrE family metallo-endopeptidase [Acidithiobacillus ferrooxidans]|uniref:helix-turn-helix domain-containing protein n=1 Tax=Acidithiobacillus ferrooxidans TaxID=920 RepID=UPI001C0671A4|nr:XRE family transcriptional regulator [Acidithiobacillus ferrooxidans]MBU2774269.1 ImmA/IrrE family metallo-endopeptidase [Acidithiobacillus ferrooxidans]
MEPTRLSRRIGYRVKFARDSKGYSQEELAGKLSFKDRQSVSDMENGKRNILPSELETLSRELGYEMDFFLDPFAVSGEGSFSWRASPDLDSTAVFDFEQRAGQWVGLMRWTQDTLGVTRNPLGYRLNLTTKSSFEDAVIAAEALVTKLSLGNIPAEKLVGVIENELDIPVLFVDTISGEAVSISGAVCHLPEMQVILVNRNENHTRMYYDLAHELFHVLTWSDMKPEHIESDELILCNDKKRTEQLADNFAAALLMPEKTLDNLIDKRFLSDSEHLLQVANKIHVSPSALAWRLFNMKWITEQTKDCLRAKPSNNTDQKPKRFSSGFVLPIHSVIASGRLSARKAAKVLGISLPGLVDLFEEYGLSAPFEL